VHHHDRLGAAGNRLFDQALVDVERVGANIDEDRNTAAQHHSVSGRYERVGRHDDLIARADVGEEAGHLERGSAGVGEQRADRSQMLRKDFAAGRRERTISGKLGVFDRLADVVELTPDRRRLIEGDHCVL
jgi:hypothetical protein